MKGQKSVLKAAREKELCIYNYKHIIKNFESKKAVADIQSAKRKKKSHPKFYIQLNYPPKVRHKLRHSQINSNDFVRLDLPGKKF